MLEGWTSNRGVDRLHVAFTTPDGRLVEASPTVAEVSDHFPGSSVVIAYDPANPLRTRVPGAATPRPGSPRCTG